MSNETTVSELSFDQLDLQDRTSAIALVDQTNDYTIQAMEEEIIGLEGELDYTKDLLLSEEQRNNALEKMIKSLKELVNLIGNDEAIEIANLAGA